MQLNPQFDESFPKKETHTYILSCDEASFIYAIDECGTDKGLAILKTITEKLKEFDRGNLFYDGVDGFIYKRTVLRIYVPENQIDTYIKQFGGKKIDPMA